MNKRKLSVFCLTGFHKHRAHVSKGLSRLTFLQPAILLLFHFNLTSSFSTCSYPLWSPLHFCYSCRTFAPQQYHFTLFLLDAPAHHFNVIQHLYLNQLKFTVGKDCGDPHGQKLWSLLLQILDYQQCKKYGRLIENVCLQNPLYIMAQKTSHTIWGSLNAITDFSKHDLGGCRICAT